MPETLLTDTPPAEHATRDAVLSGRATLWQPRDGYRAGMDAALLAAALSLRAGSRALEAGCGAGAALVQAALRHPDVTFSGVERDPEARTLADRNLMENGLAARVSVRSGDVGDGFRALGETPFDAAFANPPFFDDPSALRAPKPGKRGAWMADDGLAAWTGFLLDAVRDGGAVTLIHRADRLADILVALAPRAGGVRIRPVQPFADAHAKRVLVRAVRGARAPLALLPSLVLHERDGGRHTARADAILRGDASLHWA